MAICAELRHDNVVEHIQTLLEDRSIFMMFGYCEHDLLQIIHYHSQPQNGGHVHAETVRSIMYQLLQGCQYIHSNWIMHRDLKPANIMVTDSGQVKIGDFGLARIFRNPLMTFYSGDKVVVTIWYRAPELLLGTKHYTPAIDMWAVGCIFGELISLKPIFKGEEVKMDNRKMVPFQRSQMQRISEVLGVPTERDWPNLKHHPETPQLPDLFGHKTQPLPMGLTHWYSLTLRASKYQPIGSDKLLETPGNEGLSLMAALLSYDPERRLSAEQALKHDYFGGQRRTPTTNCFDLSKVQYPKRKIGHDHDATSLPGTKRAAIADDARHSKKPKPG